MTVGIPPDVAGHRPLVVSTYRTDVRGRPERMLSGDVRRAIVARLSGTRARVTSLGFSAVALGALVVTAFAGIRIK